MTRSPFYYKIGVLRVIDGDTIYVQIDLGFNIQVKEYIRFYNVNTPEIFGKNSSEEGQWSKLYTTLWLKGKESEFDDLRKLSTLEAWNRVSDSDPWLENLYLDSLKYNAREKYGRVLGMIYRDDGISLNESLVNRNLGE